LLGRTRRTRREANRAEEAIGVESGSRQKANQNHMEKVSHKGNQRLLSPYALFYRKNRVIFCYNHA
jgi:hypothetical protein